MIKEGDATIIAYGDAADRMPEVLRNGMASGDLMRGLPGEADYGSWIPFAVFGVLPVDEMGIWCGCWVFTSDNTSVCVRFFHRRDIEKERRVAAIWDHTQPEAGHIIAVDGYETMKAFFRQYSVEHVESVKGVMN